MLSTKPQFEGLRANASLHLLDMYIGNWFTSWGISMSGLCVCWPVNLYMLSTNGSHSFHFLEYFKFSLTCFFCLSVLFGLSVPIPLFLAILKVVFFQPSNTRQTQSCVCTGGLSIMLRFLFACEFKDNSWINNKKLKYMEKEEAWKTVKMKGTQSCAHHILLPPDGGVGLNASSYKYSVRIVLLGTQWAVEEVPLLLKVIEVTASWWISTSGGVLMSVWLLFSPLCCCVQPEELTLLLIKLRRQQAELNSLREHTVAQLMALGLEGPNAKVSTESIQ